MNIEKAGVFGGGTMGTGIIQVFASAGFKTHLVSVVEGEASRSLTAITRNLDKLVQKEKITAERRDEILSNISSSADVKDFADCGIVIEAVLEDRELKKNIFRQVEDAVSEQCIIASNTSTISITELASAVKLQERFIGVHFMNPAPVMQLIEVITALQSSQETIDTVMALCEKLGKTGVLVKDSRALFSTVSLFRL